MSASDKMDLTELVKKWEEASPYFDRSAIDIVARNSAWTIPPGMTAEQFVKQQGMGYLLGVGVLNFLCWAFDEPDRGYVPPPEFVREPE